MHEDIQATIKKLIGNMSGDLEFIDNTIPVDLQLEYFKSSNKLRASKSVRGILQKGKLLFGNSIDTKEKKKILSQLARVGKPEAFRLIEKFVKSAEGDLLQWGNLALLENRVLLESIYLEQDRVIISTGLGGKNNKLRYNIVIFINDDFIFDDTRRKIVNNEFEHIFSGNNCEIESVEFSLVYFSVLALMPFDAAVTDIISEAISESNFYGNFLCKDYIITNTKVLEKSEIEEAINNNFRNES